MHIGYLR